MPGNSFGDQRRRGETGHERGNGNGGAEEQPKVDRNDGRIARTGHQARKAAVQSDSRGRAQKERGKRADTHGCEERDARGMPAIGCRTEDETVDSRVEVSHRTEPLAQLVDVEFFCRLFHVLTLPASPGNE